MKTILISGLGGDMAQCIAKIIREEEPMVKIIGMDTSTRNAASKFCDEFLLSKKASDKDYIPFLKGLLARYCVDLFIPCTEHELRAMSEVPVEDDLWAKTLCCSKKILDICLDKLKTFEFLTKSNISVPWYCATVEEINGRFPCIYKKRKSSGSRDIFNVSTKIEAVFLSNFSPDGLFQEYLDADENELTCSVFRWSDGSTECIQLLRSLTGGATSWAKVVRDENVESLCLKVAESLELKGSLNIQLRVTKNGPMIFEINPRFSSTVLMRHMLGFKDVKWSLDSFNNRPKSRGEVVVGTEIAKVSELLLLQ